MNAKELSEKLQKMADIHKRKAEDKTHDHFDRSFDAGLALGYNMANKELLENMIKGDIR